MNSLGKSPQYSGCGVRIRFEIASQTSHTKSRVWNIQGAEVGFDALSYGTVDYYGPQNDKITTSLSQAVDRTLRGQQEPKAALDQACSEINDLLK